VTLLGERLLAVHDALDGAGIPHAFGGAIALAYCTEEPRGTRDLDVNVFAGPERAADVFAALPAEVAATGADVAAAEREGQVRLWWDDTPVDVFFDVHEFHREAAAGVQDVPFLGRAIPVLGCTALVVFKALYNRTRDWADIEAMLEAGTFDREESLRWVERLLGGDDPVTGRLAGLCAGR
jgi:hypothetical protein